MDRKCGSERSRVLYRSHMEDFLEETKLNPDVLVDEWRAVRFNPERRERFLAELNDVLEMYLDAVMGNRNLTVNSKRLRWSAVKSFFNTFRIPIEVSEPKLKPYVTYHNRSIEKEEIRRILDACELRAKTFFLMMLESGLRPDTLIRLQYKHIKKEFEEGRIPMKIEVPAAIVKDRVGDRFSFIGEDGYRFLKEYLSTRGKLQDDDYIFGKERRRGKGVKLERAHVFTNIFRDLALKLGITARERARKPFPIRMYCLRKYFRANWKGEESIREFLMGHSLGVDTHYINRDQVERFREAYAKAYPYIRVYTPTVDFEFIQQTLKQRDERIRELEKKVEELSRVSAVSWAIIENFMPDKEEIRKRIMELIGRKEGSECNATT